MWVTRTPTAVSTEHRTVTASCFAWQSNRCASPEIAEATAPVGGASEIVMKGRRHLGDVFTGRGGFPAEHFHLECELLNSAFR